MFKSNHTKFNELISKNEVPQSEIDKLKVEYVRFMVLALIFFTYFLYTDFYRDSPNYTILGFAAFMGYLSDKVSSEIKLLMIVKKIKENT